LAAERAIRRVSEGLIFEKAADYAPTRDAADFIRKSDVPWLDRFATAGGHAVISGDLKMRERLHERLALSHHGFVVVFFDPRWGSWNFFRKTALMVHWWEEIAHKIKHADKGTFWMVPASWPATPGQLTNVSIGLAQLLKDSPIARHQIPKSVPVPKRRRPTVDNRQQGLHLHDGTDNPASKPNRAGKP
jgi:hypothetical protein